MIRTAMSVPRLLPERASVRTLWAVMVATLLAAAAPVQAQLFSDDEARRAILDLRSRVEQQQRDQLRRIDDFNARLERLEQASRGQLELQNQLQVMRQEIATLRGALEVQTHELAKFQRSQRDLATELDGRIKRFEPVAVSLDGRQVNVDQAERRAYEAALATFRGGDFKGALLAFGQFLTAYPQSPYGPSVAYWSGSSQYALKDNRAAIATLQGFARANPDHPRVPDALVTIGNAQADLGDRKAAAETYRAVTERFDSSPAAQTARERLAALSGPSPRR